MFAQSHGVDARQRTGELRAENLVGAFGLALVQRFADAQDHLQPRCQRGVDLAVDKDVGLAQAVTRFSPWPQDGKYVQPTSTSIAGLTSPVNAPSFAG